MRVCPIVALWLAPWVLLAQPAPGEPNTVAAAEKFEQAKTYYNLRAFAQALSLFEESYLLSREPELLINIAQCHLQLAHYDEAISTYRAFLRDAPDNPYVPEIRRLLHEAEAQRAAASQPSSQPDALQPLVPQPQPWARWAPRTAATTAGTLGVAGLLLGGLALSAARESRSVQGAGVFDLQLERQQNAERLALASDLLLVGGVAAGGVWLWLRHRAARPQETP